MTEQIHQLLIEKGLKITPQRMAVLEAVLNLHNHPTAEEILNTIKKKHSNVAMGTVYNILDTLLEHQLIKKVKTDGDVMRYDAVAEDHHHLYCIKSDRIEDYFDQELDLLLESYFKKKNIPNFNIENIKLQIIGNFLDKKSKLKHS